MHVFFILDQKVTEAAFKVHWNSIEKAISFWNFTWYHMKLDT